MNILQFWLIDSIVKASSSSVELPTDSPRMSDVHDREPLFGAPEVDDDGCDIENPRLTYIRMPTGDDAETIVASEESKGKYSGTTSPLSIPQSTTPSSLVPHDYPPSVGSMSFHSSRSRHKYKRSPPPSLEFQTSHIPAINSPDLPRLHLSDVDCSALEGEDYAGRVEDEEQADTRTDQTKGIVEKIWRHTLGSL
jgi:hypothetical protein